MFYLVAATPRAVFFRPGSWYNSTQTGHSIVAIGEDSLLFTMGPLGGSEIGREDPLWEDYTETFSAAGAALRQTITVDSPSSLPTLDPAALSDAAQALTAQGNGTMTREAAAQLAFDLLKAENKAQEYPLPYTDVTPGTEAAHAIAYLSSYGLLTRYARDGSELDGTKFRPGEAITRGGICHAAAPAVLPALSRILLCCSGGHGLGALGVGLCDLWLDLRLAGGRRQRPPPDDPITCAQAAQALQCVADQGYPIPHF